MSWKRFLDFLERLIGVKDEVPSKPDKDEPTVPVIPPEGRLNGRKYVYKVTLDIEKADGMMVFPFEDGKLEGRLFITGRESDFTLPKGQKLLVSGVIDKITSWDGKDVTGNIQGNTELKPVEYTLTSYEVGYAIDNDKVSASGVGILNKDFKSIDNLKMSGRGKGSYELLINGASCSGRAVLVEVLDVDL